MGLNWSKNNHDSSMTDRQLLLVAVANINKNESRPAFCADVHPVLNKRTAKSVGMELDRMMLAHEGMWYASDLAKPGALEQINMRRRLMVDYGLGPKGTIELTLEDITPVDGEAISKVRKTGFGSDIPFVDRPVTLSGGFDSNELEVADQLEAGVFDLRRIKRHLKRADVEYFRDYLQFVAKKLDEGIFANDNKETLRKGEFEDFNIRHGASSVFGLRCEMMAIAIWNKNRRDTKLEHNRGDKEAELSGADCLASNQKRGWSGFPVQVKGTDVSTSIKMRAEWFDYELDRFVIVNLAKEEALFIMNYKMFKSRNKPYRIQGLVSFQELLDDPDIVCSLLKANLPGLDNI